MFLRTKIEDMNTILFQLDANVCVVEVKSEGMHMILMQIACRKKTYVFEVET